MLSQNLKMSVFCLDCKFQNIKTHEKSCMINLAEEILHEKWCMRNDAWEILHEKPCMRNDVREMLHEKCCARKILTIESQISFLQNHEWNLLSHWQAQARWLQRHGIICQRKFKVWSWRRAWRGSGEMCTVNVGDMDTKTVPHQACIAIRFRALYPDVRTTFVTHFWRTTILSVPSVATGLNATALSWIT